MLITPAKRIAIYCGLVVLCLSGLVWWMTRMTTAEKQLVGKWKMSRSYNSLDGVQGVTDLYYIFNTDRSYQSWWIDPVSRVNERRVLQGDIALQMAILNF